MADLNDNDISDEHQDWRILSDRISTSLPKRGEKDFEPDGTGVQNSALDESRRVMYKALDGERKHSEKHHVSATWYPELGKAKVDIARGSYFKSMGKADSSSTIWLLPEEVVYLVERGTMECWYPEGALMSLQAVYAACVSEPGGLERLQVYSYLKKLGYYVLRANDSLYESEKLSTSNDYSWLSCFVSSLGINYAKKFNGRRPSKILAPKRVYRSYAEIYNDIDIIPYHCPPHTASAIKSSQDQKPFQVCFDVWKPNINFRKANPGIPHYRIAVVSARDDRMPTLAQTIALFESVPADESIEAKNMIQRLKEGWRSVILAVVEAGVISFFRLADVGFGEEKIYLNIPFNNRKNRSGSRNKKP